MIFKRFSTPNSNRASRKSKLLEKFPLCVVKCHENENKSLLCIKGTREPNEDWIERPAHLHTLRSRVIGEIIRLKCEKNVRSTECGREKQKRNDCGER